MKQIQSRLQHRRKFIGAKVALLCKKGKTVNGWMRFAEFRSIPVK
jgi:hypothetical protein